MLKKVENDLLTQVGPNEPMGNLLRRFWMPALLEEEIHEPDGPPVRLRLLGEDLVAFCDSAGQIGILDAYCPHRRVHLYFGRNEACGLRCVYHGWKFDVTGQCIDMPGEPPESEFSQKVRITSYPVCIRGGVIWIFMGPPDDVPEPPDFEWSLLPHSHRIATKRLQECNWAQAVEGGLDSTHTAFLHSRFDGQRLSSTGREFPIGFKDSHPVFDVRQTEYGMLIGARREAGDNRHYWRITQFLLPNYSMVPATIEGTDSRDQPYIGHAWVPIDDSHTWVWTFSVNPRRALTKEERLRQGSDGIWGPLDERYRPLLNRANDYRIDREVQRSQTYTGIEGTANQDSAVQESMGPIVDRSRERLGASDSAIIAWRKMMLKVAKDLAAGKEPKLAKDPTLYYRRSASLIIDRDANWVAAAEPLFRAQPLANAAEPAGGETRG